MQSRVSGEGTRATSIMITPKLSRLEGLRNFAAGRRFVDDGEEAAEEALPRIAAALPWARADRSAG